MSYLHVMGPAFHVTLSVCRLLHHRLYLILFVAIVSMHFVLRAVAGVHQQVSFSDLVCH